MSLATGMSLTGVLGLFPNSWGGVYSRLGLCNHTQQCCQCHHMSLQRLQHNVCPYRTAATQTSHYSHSNPKCVHTALQQHKSVTPTQSMSVWHCNSTNHSHVITVTPTQSVSIQNCNNTNQSCHYSHCQHKVCPYRTATTQITCDYNTARII